MTWYSTSISPKLVNKKNMQQIFLPFLNNRIWFLLWKN